MKGFEGKSEVNTQRDSKERGATMVEYAVMVALIAVVVIAAVRVLGTNVSTQFSSAAGQLN